MEYVFGKKEKTLLFFSVFLVVLNSLLAGIGIYGHRTSPPIFVAALILTILSLKFYLKDKITGQLPRYISMSLVIMGISYGLWGLVYFVPTYILCGYVFMLQLPLFYICMNRGTLKSLMIYYSKSYVILSAAVILICMVAVPLSGEQYCGIFNNPNLLGQFVSSAAICVIYLYEKEERQKIRIPLLMLFGMLFALTIFSRSRTTLLAFACVAVVYLIYILITKSGLMKRMVAFLLAVMIMLPVSYGVLGVVTPAICELTGIEIDMRYSLQDELEATYDRYMKGLNNEASFTSGRSQIWCDFIEDTGLKGHKSDVLEVKYSGGTYTVNSHNTFIQVAYQSGIISGLAFVLVFGAACIYILRIILKKSFNKEDLFAAGCVANSVPYLLLANVLGPYAAYSMLPFWLITIPYYFIKQCEKGDKICNSEI